MSDASTDTDERIPPEDDEIDRRRLIRWIAVLAFAVPVAVEALTFGNIFGDELLGGGNEAAATETGTPTATERPGAVGIGDELLSGTAPTTTIETSELRETESGRTYVLGVDAENDADAAVELRLGTIELYGGATVDGLSSTGPLDPGESGMVTGAWSIDADAAPAAVEVAVIRGEERVREEFVALERPEVVE